MPPGRKKLVDASITIEGVTLLNKSLGAMDAAVKDLKFVWPSVRDAILPGLSKHFAGEGAYSGGWAPLSQKYRVWKSQNYPGKKILHRTDRLMQSLTRKTHADFHFKAKKKSMTIGTKVPYAVYHHRGTRRMPSRPPIALSPTAQKMIPKLLHAAIVNSGQLVRAPR